MGAWGTDAFANDDAMDWVAELQAARTWDLVTAALEAAQTDDYLDADVGTIALAAAEVVASAGAGAGPEVPTEVHAWLRTAPAPPASLRQLAQRAVQQVTGSPAHSELCDLWNEAEPDDRAAWHAGAAALLTRLA